MLCAHCDQPVRETARYCTRCGQALQATNPTAVPPSPTPGQTTSRLTTASRTREESAGRGARRLHTAPTAPPWWRPARPATLSGWLLPGTVVASLASLFLPWAIYPGSPSATDSSLSYSLVAALLVLVFSAVSAAAALPTIKQHGAVRMGRLTVALTLLLVLTYDLGKTGCIGCTPTTPGAGLWVAFAAICIATVDGAAAWLLRSGRSA